MTDIRQNPYASAARRYFLMVLGGAGCVAFAVLAIWCLLTQRAPGMTRYQILTEVSYAAATSPSQFWFSVFLYSSLSALCAAVAWWAYRG